MAKLPRASRVSVGLLPPSDILDCTRQGYLTEQEQSMANNDEWKQCIRRREWPGYQTLMNAKINKGG